MRGRPRRSAAVPLLALVASLALAACSGLDGASSPKPSVATGPTDLPSLAHQRGIAIGTEFVQPRYSSDYYRKMVLDNFTSITPNRSFKWLELEPQQGKFNFASSDLIVAFAQQNHLRVRGCCLAWGVAGGNPSWLLDGHWTKDQLKAMLRTYIMTVVGRYKGKVAQWDVVNEALASPSGVQGPYSVTHNFWGRIIGPEYVADAFRWAHEADPDAQLFFNDYGSESPSAKFDAELTLVKSLKAQGVPITGVGLQMHRPVPTTPPYYPTTRQVRTVLQELTAAGFHTELTELDQALPLPAKQPQLRLQAQLYQQMVAVCLSVALCTGVTVWGVDDDDRYASERANNLGAATLFAAGGQIKPAFLAVVEALRKAPGPGTGARASPGLPA